jgi:transporter family-2 protein
VTNLYLLVGVFAGAGIAAQAVINARLRLILGAPLWAAATQFIVGLTLLLVVALATRQPAPATAGLARAPWWIWLGGIFGATFIVVSIVLTPRLGTALMLASVIVGQLAAALLIDHFGLFGASVIRMSPMRVLGAALLVLGVVLLRRNS